MQTVMDRMILLKSETEQQELKIQKLFESMLSELRTRFEQQSNLLRADFIELQRQEQELKMTSIFIKEEFTLHNKEDKSQKRVSIAGIVAAHSKLTKAVRD